MKALTFCITAVSDFILVSLLFSCYCNVISPSKSAYQTPTIHHEQHILAGYPRLATVDSRKMVFSEVSPRIYTMTVPGIRITVEENLGKKPKKVIISTELEPTMECSLRSGVQLITLWAWHNRIQSRVLPIIGLLNGKSCKNFRKKKHE